MDAPELAEAIARQEADMVAARLAPQLTSARRARIEAVLRARVGSVQIAVEDPQDPLLERRRARLARAGDPSEQEVAERRARWYAKAVDPRLARHALGLGKEYET